LMSLLIPDIPLGGEAQCDTKIIKRPSNIFYKDNTTVEHHIFDPPEALSGNQLRYSLAQRYGKLYALVTCPRHPRALELQKPIPHKLVIKDASIGRSRIKNKLKKWYAGFLANLPVPLPESEWMELRDLAMGKTQWEGQPKRRVRVGRRPFHLSTRELERFVYLEELDPSLPLALEPSKDGIKTLRPLPKFRNHRVTIPLFDLEGTWLESKELRHEVTQDILEEELQITDRFAVRGERRSNPHIITSRFMRRLWAKVFRGIPLLQKTVDEKWSVTWGHDELMKVETPKDLSTLFESLEGCGTAMIGQTRGLEGLVGM